MKKIFFFFCFLGLLAGGNTFGQESTTKIKIKVKDADGHLIEKEYDSEEAMRNDPELEELGIEVGEGPGRVFIRSHSREGENRQIMVFKHKGGAGEDDFSYEYRTGNPNHFFSDSVGNVFRQRFHADSMGFGEAFVRMREQRTELDSLKERRVYVRTLNDSLREVHVEDMEKHREEMKQHMAEMREHMKEMQERMREMEVMDGGNRIIMIRHITKEDAEKLEVKDQSLQLDAFKLYPNPREGNLKVEFGAKESGPVQIKLMDATGSRVLYDDTRDPAGGFYQGTISVGQHEPGTYILQIIQNNKALSRRVIMR